MLTTEPTQEMIAEWKRIFENYRAGMQPDRRSGAEVDAYFRERYPCQIFEDAEFCDMVAAEIMENDFLREKLPEGVMPDVRSYTLGDILIGIDINSGQFHMESEDMEKVVPIYNDLFVFRGLDEKDLNNFFLVAEYVELSVRQSPEHISECFEEA